MFEQTDYRVAPFGESLLASLPERVGQATGAGLVQVGPAAWSGRGPASNFRMAPLVMVQAMPAPGGTAVQITIGAEVDTTGWILFVVCCVFFWPAAALIGFLGYDDFNKRRQYALQVFWSQLGAPPMQPPMPGPYGMVPPR
ncbi:MAG TPA: hypothetical protein VGG39_26400 [Polyangiaceae bacterium]|jgi:hypothetical protein